MPMKQSLFDKPTAKAKAKAGTPAADTDPTQSGVTREEFMALVDQFKNTNQAVTGLTAYLKELASTPADNRGRQGNIGIPDSLGEPTAEDDDALLDEFTKQPNKVLDTRIDARVLKLAESEVAPLLMKMVDSTHKTLMDSHQVQINQAYGDGAWDLIQPQLKEDFDKLGKLNYQALGNQESVDSLVYRRLGMPEHRVALETHRNEHAPTGDTMDDNLIITGGGLPKGGTGARIRTNGTRMDPDTKLFFDEIEAATGQKTDKENFAKLHETGNTIEDYLAVVTSGEGN